MTGYNRQQQQQYIGVLAPRTTALSCRQTPAEFSRITQGETSANVWRGYGENNHSLLENVARTFLGAPGLAVLLQRDFGEAWELVNRQSGSFDPSFVETVVFLREADDPLPDYAAALPPVQRAEAIPVRLNNTPKKRQRLRTSPPGSTRLKRRIC